MLSYDRKNWLKPLFTLRGSVLPIVLPRMFLAALFSLGLTIAFKAGRISSISGGAHAALGTTLGLVLAFRTSTAYDRFWEARKAWGLIANRSRDLMRQCNVYVRNGGMVADCARYLIGFLHATKSNLWRQKQTPELAALFGNYEAVDLEVAPGPAQRCLERITSRLDEAHRLGLLGDNELLLIDRNLTELLDQFGVCQRIKHTPLPFAYVVYMRRFIVLYLITLPFPLVSELGWMTPGFVMIAAYALFGLEEIGVQVEDPFDQSPNDLGLATLVRRIERDVRNMSGLASDVAPPASVEFKPGRNL
jgi:ion channel-forming bestrophin family protein